MFYLNEVMYPQLQIVLGTKIYPFFLCPGLTLTYVALYVMNGHGQPALLYLVPCTLGISKAQMSNLFHILKIEKSQIR